MVCHFIVARLNKPREASVVEAGELRPHKPVQHLVFIIHPLLDKIQSAFVSLSARYPLQTRRWFRFK